MLYDRRDFGLLRLAGTYQWLPAAPLKKLSALKTLRREAELLSTLGLVSYARSGEYLMPSRAMNSFPASTRPVSRLPNAHMRRAPPSAAGWRWGPSCLPASGQELSLPSAR